MTDRSTPVPPRLVSEEWARSLKPPALDGVMPLHDETERDIEYFVGFATGCVVGIIGAVMLVLAWRGLRSK